uniref:Maelstrom domain-containing protein n=1 Tax=Photinus pyralis TaxID=7054 RepID=A0A1Y1LN04_PHOPY
MFNTGGIQTKPNFHLLQNGMPNRNVPLYASDKNAPVVANVIQQLSDAFGIPEYRIFSLQHLFFTLRNSSSKGKVWIASSLAQTELETDKFEFFRETVCSFHENVDVISHCSQSIAIRTVYTIANNCCADMGIDLISGQHVPKSAQIKSTRMSSHASSISSSSNGSSWEQPSRRRQPMQAGYLSRGETEPSELSDTSTMIDPNENYEGSEDEWHVAKSKKKHSPIESNNSSSDYTQTSGSKLRRPVGLSSALAGVSKLSLSNEPRGRGRGIAANYSNAKK